MNKLFSHFRSDDISSMTQVLKCLNPNDSCSFDCGDKEIEPDPLSFFKQQKGKTANRRNEDYPQLNESNDMPEDIDNAFPDSEDFLLVSVGDDGGILGGGLEWLMAFESSRRDGLGVEINWYGGEEQSVGEGSDPAA
jgi:hypothetical protein